MPKAAVFWDRDNTLMADPGYLSDPYQVALLPGAAEALRRASAAGYENIVVSNQSGVARGLFDEPTLERIHDRLCALLAAEGARLDAIYYCPYLPGDEAVVEQYRQDSDLRKPKPGMLVKASLERRIDLPASWSVGDALRDVQAGRAAGCRTILLHTDSEPKPADAKDPAVDFIARSPVEAVEIILAHSADGEGKPQAARQAHATADQREVAVVLHEILAFLKTADRRAQTHDFSLARLAGVIVQILALAALLWAAFGWFFAIDDLLGTHMLRMLMALLLQTLALTLFVAASRK